MASLARGTAPVSRAAPATIRDVATAFPIGASVRLEQLEGDPHALLAQLREREPVSWLPALEGWLVTRHDLAEAVVRDAGTFTVDDPRFSTARVVGVSMLSLDGERHARHRAPFVAPFRITAVRERFQAPVAQDTEELLTALAGGSRRRTAPGVRRTARGPDRLSRARPADIRGRRAARLV